MSDVAQRRSPEPVLTHLTRRLPAAAELVPALLLGGVGVALASRWWTQAQDVSASLSRGVLDLPVKDLGYQLPALAVLGLLFVLGAAPAGDRSVTRSRLSQLAARWSWAWVATSIVAVALTASQLTGMPVVALVSREDLLGVLARSDRAGAQIATLWVALVIALFANRLTSAWEMRALVVLAAATLLPVVANLPTAGHDGPAQHGGPDLHRLAMVALAVQLLAAVLWFGLLLVMVLHVRLLPAQLRPALVRYTRTSSVCVLLVGLAALVHTALSLPALDAVWTTTDGQLVLARAVGLLLLAAVGYRHRRRTSDVASDGGLVPLLRLVGGELVLMGAVLAVTLLAIPAS
jgi:putative copper export protein